jgi:hypothetical protein
MNIPQETPVMPKRVPIRTATTVSGSVRMPQAA